MIYLAFYLIGSGLVTLLEKDGVVNIKIFLLAISLSWLGLFLIAYMQRVVIKNLLNLMATDLDTIVDQLEKDKEVN